MKRKTTNKTKFIRKAKKIYGNKYLYSKIEYKGSKDKLNIVCRKHGEFSVTPTDHLSKGYECSECKKEERIDSYIKDIRKKYKNKYEYDFSGVKTIASRIKIKCETHGEFTLPLDRHMRGQECPKCENEIKLTPIRFKKRADIIHKERYDYSKIKNVKGSVDIICSIHGVFSVDPKKHLKGIGCPKCGISKGEARVEQYLIENNIEYVREKIFDGLDKKRFDFYLSKKNVVIEYDGVQHFKAIEFFGGEKGLEKIKTNDKLKDSFCRNKNIKVLRIPYTDYDNIYNILKKL